jgi:hypothetical protein
MKMKLFSVRRNGRNKIVIEYLLALSILVIEKLR